MPIPTSRPIPPFRFRFHTVYPVLYALSLYASSYAGRNLERKVTRMLLAKAVPTTEPHQERSHAFTSSRSYYSIRRNIYCCHAVYSTFIRCPRSRFNSCIDTVYARSCYSARYTYALLYNNINNNLSYNNNELLTYSNIILIIILVIVQS